MGFEPEDRPFLPHATVARVRARMKVDAPDLSPPRPVAFDGERITLYRSRTASTGAVYEALERARL